MAKRYESLNSGEIIPVATMEAMAKDAFEHGWVFTWQADRTMVTVLWDEDMETTYTLVG